MALDKDKRTGKKKKASNSSKRTSPAKNKTANSKSVKKKKVVPAKKKKKAASQKKKIIKGKKIKRYSSSDDNIMAKTLPDWIISSQVKKRPGRRPFNKLLAFSLMVSLILLFVFIKSSVIRKQKNPDTFNTKKTVSLEKGSKASPKRTVKRAVREKKYTPAPLPAKPVKSPALPVKDGPYIVFVLDDIGNTKKDKQLLVDLSDNITYAILPFLPYSGYFSDLSVKTGSEVLLHLPIESKRGNEKDPGKISPVMSRDQIISQLNNDLKAVPFCVGANNHKGSLGTSDIRLMRIILSDIKSRGMFFLDSYTTKDSVVSSICKQIGLPVLRRDIFLDNIDSPDKIVIQISKLSKTAKEKGYAIGIGHYRHNTLEVLNKSIPLLKKQGFSIISLQSLIKIIYKKH